MNIKDLKNVDENKKDNEDNIKDIKKEINNITTEDKLLHIPTWDLEPPLDNNNRGDL